MPCSGPSGFAPALPLPPLEGSHLLQLTFSGHNLALELAILLEETVHPGLEVLHVFRLGEFLDSFQGVKPLQLQLFTDPLQGVHQGRILAFHLPKVVNHYIERLVNPGPQLFFLFFRSRWRRLIRFGLIWLGFRLRFRLQLFRMLLTSFRPLTKLVVTPAVHCRSASSA